MSYIYESCIKNICVTSSECRQIIFYAVLGCIILILAQEIIEWRKRKATENREKFIKELAGRGFSESDVRTELERYEKAINGKGRRKYQ